MKSYALSLALAVVAIAGCTKEPAHQLPMPTVDQVDQWITAGAATAIDANNAGTRAKMGVVPGAIKLTAYDSYDLGELPADKSRKLIFYCANTQCGASHKAAERALAAGWHDVGVMPAGIAGWALAGKKVDRI